MSTSIPDHFFQNGTVLSLGEGKLLVGMGKRSWKKTPDTSTSFYFPDFFLSDVAPWFVHETIFEVTVDQLINAIKEPENGSDPILWNRPDATHFSETFDTLQKKFLTGELLKAVPFAFEFAPASMSIGRLKKALVSVLHYAKKYPAFVYGFWEKGEGILGATPELLFSVYERAGQSCLDTVAMAGTRLYDPTDDVAFRRDGKELREHQVVIEGIREALSPLGRVQVGDLEVVHLSRLSHLKTPIQVELTSKVLFEDVIRRLHPTPALGAFPRDNGMEWLRLYQKEIPRFRFGAPVGCLMPQEGKALCYVAIRNVQWISNEMRVGAGCGVIAASEKEREWSEIGLKISATKEMLALT